MEDKLIGDEGFSSDRKVPMVRIPDEFLRSILGLLEAYEDRNNPSPTSEDIALRLGESVEVVTRACRKLEISGVVVKLVQTYEDRSNPAPTARDMAAGLDLDLRGQMGLFCA